MKYDDPLSVDRELRTGAERWRNWRRALRRGVVNEAPFGGSLRFGKTLYDWTQELPADFPLRAPLGRWVYRLAEQRINAPWLAREAALSRVETHIVREPVEGRFSLSQMTRAALRGRDAPAWHEARLGAVSGLAAHRAILWQRRQEIAERMGLSGPDEIELPSAAVYGEAEAFLAETDEVVGSVSPGWTAFVESALAREASEGWPARMAPDTFRDLLGHADWLRAVPLDPGPLPERLAPASFLRGLARLGAGWQTALAPHHQPFVVAHDPFGLAAWSSGALWAWLACQPTFLQGQLGLSRARARAHQRHLALAVSQSVRLLAGRCLARRSALVGGDALREQSRELSLRLVRQELPHASLLGVTRLRIDDPARLCGCFLAVVRHQELVESHDEDWYRAPRAVEQLREEAGLTRSAPVEAEALARGRTLLQRWLVESLSG